MTKETSKVETVGEHHRIPNPKFSGECDELSTIDISKNKGIQALFCVDQKKIKTYLFDVTLWTLEEAKEWVSENAKDASQKTVGATMEKTSDGLLAIASDDVEDRDNESVSIDGWNLDHFKKNPVLLWMHNRSMAHDGRPIGKAEKIGYKTIDGKKRLVFRPIFDDTTQFNRELKQMVEKLGVPNSFSVGFMAKERDGNVIKKQELLEISLVPIGSNRNARFLERAKEYGFDKKVAKQFVEIKTTVSYRAYDPAPEARQWDSTAATRRVREWAGGPAKEDVDFNRYKEGFTWFDADDSENFGAYKLPHHDVVGGNMVTVWRGVAAAMAALLGARGGTDVPDADRRKIYNHLAKHYEQFDKEVPDFRSVESQELKEMFSVVEELVKVKAFKDFKKQNQYIEKFVRETIKQKKESEQKALEQRKQESKLVMSSILKKVDEKIAESLEGDKSQGKEEK